MPYVTVVETATRVVQVAEDTINVVIAGGQVTQVAVAQLAASLSQVKSAADVEMGASVDQSLLVYRASSQKFEARKVITISPDEPSGGAAGDLWFKYTP